MSFKFYRIDAREREEDGNQSYGLFVVAESAREAVALWGEAQNAEHGGGDATFSIIHEKGWTLWRRTDEDGDHFDIPIIEVAAFLTATIDGPSRILANEEFPAIDETEWM